MSQWLPFLFILGLCGCADEKPLVASEGPKPSPPLAKPVTDRPGNPQGEVLIVEYHRIAKEEARWDRSVARFKSDLGRLYKLGFRPVKFGDFLTSKMNLPKGASPVIFTFDDSDPSQFRILDDGTIDPNCAVGIWKEFAEKHPDFPIRATFYVLPPTPWGQKQHLEAKLKMLKEWDCELGSHTMTHRSLAKLSSAEVKKEFADSIRLVNDLGFECATLALPFGIAPKEEKLIHEAGFRGALLVGANPSPNTFASKFNRLRIPRIQAIEGDYGITYWLDRVEKGQVSVYVQP